MKLVFDKIGAAYAHDPQVTRRAGKMLLTMKTTNCTHFFVFSYPLDNPINLLSEEIRNWLESNSERILSLNEESIGEGRLVSCVDFISYRLNNAVIIPDRVAGYAVLGAKEDKNADTLTLFMPNESTDYTYEVNREVSYSVQPYIVSKVGLFKKVTEHTPFWEVRIDSIPNYQDGNICYRIEGMPWEYPVTAAMLGKTVYVYSEASKPSFFSRINGLNLKSLKGVL